MQPNAREAASFLKENFVPLQKHGVLKFVPQELMFAWLPEISIMFCNGHTEAMMVPVIYVEGRPIVFSADTMPSVHHIGMPYVMAYDIRPLDSLQEKEQILNLLVENNGIIIFEHDSQHECATVIKDEKGRIKADRVGQLAEILSA
jgi:glyoxylase-like metal-dependent hydrolase (beta-lactamase superfamily II)